MFYKIFLMVFLWCLNCYALSKDSNLTDVLVIPQYSEVRSDVKKIGVLTKIRIKDGWHLYWDNPGDVGEPTKIEFIEKDEYFIVSVKKTQPKKSVFEDIITSYVYEGDVYFYDEIYLNKSNIKDDVIDVDLIVAYNVCKDDCLAEKINKNVRIKVGQKNIINDDFSLEYEKAKETFGKEKIANFKIEQNNLYIEFEQSIRFCESIEFISKAPKKNILANLPRTSVIDDMNIKVEFDEGELLENVEGVLQCNDVVYDLVKNVGMRGANNNEALYYLLLAFIAGLILNLMPCVLPVLGIKALAIVMNNKKADIKGALLYMLGVLSSFSAMAGIIFYAKHIGKELGWGFQLQSVYFNIFLLMLFFVIFLNLMDKIHISDKWSGKLDKFAKNKNFLMGFFAVLIACPCTGPFMGSAIGYAINKSDFVYWGIFLMLGAGYAIPYVLVEMYPNVFLKYIPKPGAWMIKLKRSLAVLIALTCFWLGWVIYNQLFYKSVLVDVEWQEYSSQKVEEDLKNNKSVFINFTAKWCLVCLFNEKTTLGTKEFKDFMNKNDVSLYKADWTSKDDEILKELSKYGRNSVPLYVFYGKKKEGYVILNQILTIGEISKLF